ncbi:MAG TPA: transglycosylase SLT domain-containing protein [Candidatus Limnocylindrales bacterium]
MTLSGPTPNATATPSANSAYFLAGQIAPIATPTPTPAPTPIPDTVANARAYARSHLDARQFGCVDVLWESESRWNPRATNVKTGAYGIPQSLPATKMATFGRNWRTSPKTQVSWGLQYIARRYGTPCQAWSFRIAHGWY